MNARRGSDFLNGLDDDREVWLGSRRVNVLDEPAFKGSLQGVSEYFDWQHRYADECLMEDPETGDTINASLLIPRSYEDLARRHVCLERLCRYSYGMLGRTPDYVNVALSGQVARQDISNAHSDPVYHERLRAFHREVKEKDLALTHTIVHASIDKGVPELDGMNADLTLRAVDRTQNGLIVRGAKVLATLGPFADEIFVYPAFPIPEGKEDYALSFSVPLATKGLKVICRDHYGIDASREDRPFSSRFDEQDAFIIFDDVEVPWERVFIDGNLAVNNAIAPGVSAGNTSQQTSIRAAVKLEFAYDLCTEMARVMNAEKRPEITMMLGEIATYLSITRALIAGAELRGYDWGAGAFFCHPSLESLRVVMPGWMIRVNEIIKTLGSHNLLATPELGAFDNPEIGPLLEKYLPGAGGKTARDRARIMRTAWEFAGSALGSRIELYERFYLGSVPRCQMSDHRKMQAREEWGQLNEFLETSGIETGN